MSNEDKNLKTSFQVLTVALTLLVFGAAIWIAKEQMGERIREQVLADPGAFEQVYGPKKCSKDP